VAGAIDDRAEAAQKPQRGVPRDLLLFLLIEAAGFTLYTFAFVVAAGVAFTGGFAAGVAFLAALVVFGRIGRRSEAAERAQCEQEG